MTKKHAEQGFTMVEILVATGVMAILTAAVFGLFSTIQQAQLANSYRQSATRAASREIEVLRNNNYDQLTPGTDIDFSNELPATLPNGTGTVTVTEPVPGLRRVDVVVSYTHSGATKQVKLSSMIGVIGITQWNYTETKTA